MKDQEKIEKIDKIMEQAGNFISVDSGVVVCSEDSLEKVEKCVNRLIKKHRDFLLMKKTQKTKAGYFG